MAPIGCFFSVFFVKSMLAADQQENKFLYDNGGHHSTPHTYKGVWEMIMEERERYAGSKGRRKENFIIWMTNPMLYDRLHILSAEYSVSEEMLVNIAVKRLLDDVDFVRNLRIGRIKPE